MQNMLLIVTSLIALSCVPMVNPTLSGSDPFGAGDYKNQLKNLEGSGFLAYSSDSTESAMDELLFAAKRNLELINLMNEDSLYKLDQSSTFSISAGDPADPIVYGPPIFVRELARMKKDMPAQLRDFYFKNARITISHTVKVPFLSWSRKIDQLAQQVLRWRTVVQRNRSELSKRKAGDVRPYIFLSEYSKYFSNLSKSGELKNDLDNFKTLNIPLQQKLLNNLLNLCILGNTGISACERRLSRNLTRNNLYSFYEDHLSDAKKVFDSYFKIEKSSKVFRWSAGKLVVGVNSNYEQLLRLIKESAVAYCPFLKIEDSTGSSSVKLEFTSQNVSSANQKKNTIYWSYNFDNNLSSSKRIMIHELGHILGFKDCYVEFLDESTNSATFYSIDKSNIMCSTTGSVQVKHYSDLRNTYKN